jgi:hypothetical protein
MSPDPKLVVSFFSILLKHGFPYKYFFTVPTWLTESTAYISMMKEEKKESSSSQF